MEIAAKLLISKLKGVIQILPLWALMFARVGVENFLKSINRY